MSATATNTTHAILLTGSGTIGSELLVAMLRNTKNRVSLLMRDRGRRTAWERARKLFDTLRLTPDDQARIEVLRGDVTRAGLGLDAATQARVVEGIDLLVHTAAVTSLTADARLCDEVNRAGTANALILAERCYTRGRLDRFVHLSTAFVAGSGSRGVIREDELVAAPVHTNHYEASKYEAERIVRAAMHAGLPVTVFRPSLVVGDTNSGRTRDFNVIYPLMRMMASGYVSQFPGDPDAPLHLAPVDFVLDALVAAIDAPWTSGLTFHLTAPRPPAVRELFECEAFFPDATPRARLAPPDGFEPSVLSARERDLLDSVSFSFPYFSSRLSFETTNTARLVPLPVTDAEWLSRLGRYAVESGYIPRLAPPAWEEGRAVRAR